MGNGQSTSSGTKTLAKVARGDARAAQQVSWIGHKPSETAGRPALTFPLRKLLWPFHGQLKSFVKPKWVTCLKQGIHAG